MNQKLRNTGSVTERHSSMEGRAILGSRTRGNPDTSEEWNLEDLMKIILKHIANERT